MQNIPGAMSWFPMEKANSVIMSLWGVNNKIQIGSKIRSSASFFKLNAHHWNSHLTIQQSDKITCLVEHKLTRNISAITDRPT